MHGSVLTVTVPNAIFNIVPQTFVYNADHLPLELANLPQDWLFPRLGANAQNAEALTTSYAMYLPSKYAPLLLDNNGYAVEDTWTILSMAFKDDNFTDRATPILNWLHVTLHATQNNHRGLSATLITLTAPFLDQDLANHWKVFLQNTLPALHDVSPGLDTEISYG